MKQVTSKDLCIKKKGTGITETFAVGTCDGISLEITGEATNFNIEFECSLSGKKWVPIEGCYMSNQSDFSTSTTKLNEIISFDVGMVSLFRVNIIENNSVDGIDIIAITFID
jgi:hypothetical protein